MLNAESRRLLHLLQQRVLSVFPKVSLYGGGRWLWLDVERVDLNVDGSSSFQQGLRSYFQSCLGGGWLALVQDLFDSIQSFDESTTIIQGIGQWGKTGPR